MEVINVSTIAIDALYGKVSSALGKPENVKLFSSVIDKNLTRHSQIYSAIGPLKRPNFTASESQQFFQSVGLTEMELKETLVVLKKSDSRWGIQGINYPFNLAHVLSLRYWIIKNDERQIKNAISYYIAFTYPLLHKKYLKYEPTESIMIYAINHLSNKYRLKQIGNLWGTLVDIMEGCLKLHKTNIKTGNDDALVRYLTDARTRINSFMRKINNAFYEAHKNGLYLQTDADNFDEDKYHEADSNTLLASRLANGIFMKLIVSGPDMKLVEMAAKNCNVSVNSLRNYTQAMINGDNQEDIRQIIESLLNMYLVTNTNGSRKTARDVGSNDFLIYCMSVYKKSNTIDPDVIRIKKILDKWLVDLELKKKGVSGTTMNNFRKALFMFFVLTVVKLA